MLNLTSIFLVLSSFVDLFKSKSPTDKILLTKNVLILLSTKSIASRTFPSALLDIDRGLIE